MIRSPVALELFSPQRRNACAVAQCCPYCNACAQIGHLAGILAPGRPTACLQAVHDPTACFEAARTARDQFTMLIGLVSMMLRYVTVNSVVSVYRAGCSKQTALEGQDWPCTYLAHHEPQSGNIVLIITPVAPMAVT